MTQDFIDLSSLRKSIDNDRELELELFEEYISSSQELLTKIAESLDTNDSEAWRAGSHALKGLALSLGAHKLGKTGAAAQSCTEQDQKPALLEQMQQENKQVLGFLENEQ